MVLSRPRELGRAGHWAERERKRRSGPAGFGIFGLGVELIAGYSLQTRSKPVPEVSK